MCIAAGFLLLCPLLPVPLRHRRRYCLRWCSGFQLPCLLVLIVSSPSCALRSGAPVALPAGAGVAALADSGRRRGRRGGAAPQHGVAAGR